MNFPTTPTPNIIFDYYMSRLKEAEFKELMAVVRQTLGWYDPATGNRKKWDRMNLSQFKDKTGMSVRSLSPAFQSLYDMELIEIRNGSGLLLDTPKLRRRSPNDLHFSIGRAIIEGTKIIR